MFHYVDQNDKQETDSQPLTIPLHPCIYPLYKDTAGGLVAVILIYSCCEFNLHLQRICPMVGGKRKDRDKKNMERMKEGCAFITMMPFYHSEQTALITQSIYVCTCGY